MRVLLVDDQPLIRAGLTRILDPQPELEVVGECSDGDEVPEAVRAVRARRDRHGRAHEAHERRRGAQPILHARRTTRHRCSC